MNISKKEIENVSKLESFKRYRYTIKRIADFEELWTILDKNSDIALSDIEDQTFVSFWPAKEFIGSNLNLEWEECSPYKFDLDDFEEKLIPLIKMENYLINVFPVEGKSGFVVNLDEFIRDLNDELKQYE